MKTISFLLHSYQYIGAAVCVLFTAASMQAQPMNNSSPESNFINAQWALGLAAGNADDWYINADGNHENFPSGDFAQLNRYADGSTYGFQTSIRNAPRNVLGNASLGVGGSWGMTRYKMYTYYGTPLYNQYRANQHYFYPAVFDTGLGNQARDLTFAMHPYSTQSVGKSHSERDEVRKFFLGLAALRPDVKTILEDEGLLIPTLQMVWRRTRVANDAEYLTGLAHPSAFDNVANDYDMVVMANDITADKIPPLVQMQVVEENFLSSDPTKFNERSISYSGEYVFNTPLAMGRIWRGPEYTKRMVIDVSGSIDVNNLDLTYDFVVLRGDSSKVRFTPLNAEGTLMEIEMDYFTTFTDPNSGELTNMLVIGVFANNGFYYSSPAFITCSTLWNEARLYGSDKLLDSISYNSTQIDPGVSYDRVWMRDHYQQDAYGRVFKYQRESSTGLDTYSAEGYLVLEEDADGLPTKVTQVSYSADSNSDTTVAPTYIDTVWQYEIDMDYSSESIPPNGSFVHTAGVTTASFSVISQPTHGTVSIQYTQGGIGGSSNPGFTYTPATDFTGVDIFVVREYDTTLQQTIFHKVRMVVGPADTEDPQQVLNVQVIGQSIEIAHIIWGQTSDNYEVARFLVYRDGGFIGYSYGREYFDTVTPGEEYTYTVVAEDDAGNQSTVSVGVLGGGATIFAQDDFEDSKLAVVDPALQNGLAWTLLSGGVNTGTNLKPGTYQASPTLIITDQFITPPFTMDFTDTQAYNTNSNGPVFLYQDVDNYYHLTINRDTCSLYRRMDGVDTLIGSSDAVCMQHFSSTARFQVTVIATGGLVTFKVVRREWTVSPDLVNEAFFFDTDATAFARFASGPVGFKQFGLSTYNVATFDNLYLTREEGEGPDIDGDGLIDAWERAYFGDYGADDANPTSDPDQDGMSTADELLWGTNPTNGGSLFSFDLGGSGSGNLSLSWPSIMGRQYTVWFSPDLSGWTEVSGLIDITPTPPTNTVELDLPVDGPGFFRIEVEATP